MDATKQQPQQQAAAQPREPLDQLQLMLNQVLESTGRLLKESTKPADRERAAAMATRLKSIIPAANNGFQDALDALETQLTMARWALNRDLDALRQKKAAPTPPATNGAASQAKETDLQDTKPTNTTSTNKPTEASHPPAPAAASNGNAANDSTDADAAIDFDALFNDPSDAPAEQPPASESTFLPGLESYANNDGADGAADQPAAAQTNTAQQQQQQNGNQEPSFDDLMNFDGFDFNSLGADGDDGGATFDESFFDVE